MSVLAPLIELPIKAGLDSLLAENRFPTETRKCHNLTSTDRPPSIGIRLARCAARDMVDNVSNLDIPDAINQLIEQARLAHAAGNKLIFIGNGGSAAIASHMATDYSKNGGIRSVAMNDSSMITCLTNDLGYDQVVAKQIELHARPSDILIAISSSGRSKNIINAVRAARHAKCSVVTLSGFAPDNPLRRLGDSSKPLRKYSNTWKSTQ